MSELQDLLNDMDDYIAEHTVAKIVLPKAKAMMLAKQMVLFHFGHSEAAKRERACKMQQLQKDGLCIGMAPENAAFIECQLCNIYYKNKRNANG